MVGVRQPFSTGSYHAVDSSELAFKIAGSMAFQGRDREGETDSAQANREVEVTVPDATSWATSLWET